MDNTQSGITIKESQQTFGRIIICEGCCCGNTKNGNPAVPHEWLDAEFHKDDLFRTIGITFSGCIGLCKPTNLICILTKENQYWLAGLTDKNQYGQLIEWAREVKKTQRIIPLPKALLPHVVRNRFR